MLQVIKDFISNKMQTTPQRNHTMIDTRKLSPAKRTKIKSEATKPVTKGRKPSVKKMK